jgi:flagellar basal-body rod modification protein FlgD
MSVSAVIENGKVQENYSTKSTESTSNGYDQDAFMKILSAQMKYQDPLEPTSNTEYISQYAQFTQVEQLSNMANAMSLSRASDLVGKVVIMETTNSSGETSYIQGKVDYVTYSGNKALLNIDGKEYNIDDLYAVADQDYVEADENATSLADMIDKFPNYAVLTVSDYETVTAAWTLYDSMTDEAKNMMSSSYITKLTQYKTRMDQLVEEYAKANSNTENETETETVEG